MEVSRVKVSLREIQDQMNRKRGVLEFFKATTVPDIQSWLTNLATNYADLKSTIDGYTPTGPVETECQDMLAKLIAERASFLTDVNTLITDLSTLTEF